MEKINSELRKGTWTQEEDNLLRACVHKYGEGKWHLVPHRAGLRRCRKSCRMRWLNYLKPNITRESFTDDEVDMIRRLHKLLGNRWSLIAGRLPGRTANDVKNFWHTSMRNRKKEESQERKEIKEANNKNDDIEETRKVKQQHVVIKPQPHSFSKNSPWLRSNNDNKNKVVSASEEGDAGAGTSSVDIKEDSVAERDQSEEWWESLLNNGVDEGQFGNFTMEFWDQDLLKMEGSLGKARVVGVTVRTSSS